MNADAAERQARDRLATDLHDFLFYDGPDGHHVFRFSDARVTCGEDEYVRPAGDVARRVADREGVGGAVTVIDPAAVHADPDGGIRWDLNTGEVLRADPVISVSVAEFWRLRDNCVFGDGPAPGDPRVSIDGLIRAVAAGWPVPVQLDTNAPALTRWTFANAEHLYRVHSYDPDTDCYLLVWPD